MTGGGEEEDKEKREGEREGERESRVEVAVGNAGSLGPITYQPGLFSV